MKKIASLVIALALPMLGCSSVEVIDSSGTNLVEAQGVVTLVNLHPDTETVPPRFSAVNWIRPALLPMCTEVTIVAVGRKKAQIRDNKTGTLYNYIYHKAAAEPFPDHLKRFFGTKCDADKVAKLSAVDRDGIKKGKAIKGMTKQGVIYALGYPARHVTPSTEADMWKYWKGRFDTMQVYFENGKVSKIVD